jgi:hypothetical protein
VAGSPLNAQYAPIFKAVGARYNIPPAVLAGVMDVETNGGRNTAVSSAGAIGPMQFMPGTARALGVNPNNPVSAIDGAARLLLQYGYRSNPIRALGAYNGGPGNPQISYANLVMSQARRLAPELQGAASSGLNLGAAPQAQGTSTYQVSQTVPNPQLAALSKALSGTENLWGKSGSGFGGKSVLAYMPATVTQTKTYTQATGDLQQLAGGTSLNAHPAVIQKGKSGYVNPIPGAQIGRTDMGVDASYMADGHPILAIGDSKVIGISPNWYKGQPYVLFQLTSGPLAGRYYYVAEAINPTVRPGQNVRAGQVIGTYNRGGTGLELGWGSPTPGRTLAQAQGQTGDVSHGNAPAGQSFRSFLGNL